MKKLILLGLATAMSAAGGLTISKSINAEREEKDARIIVQLDSPLGNKTAKRLHNEQSAVINSIRNEVTTNYTISSRFTNVLNAFAMQVNSKHVSHIRNLPGVKKVVYDTYREVSSTESDLAKRTSTKIEVATENLSKETMNVPDGTNEGEGTLIAILDSSFMIHATSPEKDPIIKDLNDATHATFTALDDSLSVKYTRDEIKAVINHTEGFHGHDDDTHDTYLNNKVPFFYDYGGDVTLKSSSDDRHPGEEDYDVYTEGSEHGNHVASIAAGNDPLYKGIAPKAQLACMKVFTASTYYAQVQDDSGTISNQKVISVGAYDECILKAFEDCAILGVDVINMSLGSALSELKGSDSLAFEAIANLEKQGIEFSISAGNEGKETFYNSAYEYWTTDQVEHGILGSYATSDNGMIVAAGEPSRQYYDAALVVGNSVVAFSDQVTNRANSDDNYNPERHFTDLLSLEGHSDGKFEWIKIPGLGSTQDFDSLKKNPKDLTEKVCDGKIAVIDRGEITFAQKIENAQDAGAIAVAIIDNNPSATDFTFRMAIGYTPKVPVVAMLHKDKTCFGEGGDVGECTLIANDIQANPKAKQVSTYSSDGPTGDLRMKADILTPGSNILGAVYEGGEHAYEYFSGTSMAAPNFAGAYALMLSQDVNNAAWRSSLNDRIMSAAVPSKDALGVELESARRQGAGHIDVKKALETEVYLDGSANPDELLGRAKIELLNNADIKGGKVDLQFTTISDKSTAVTYDTELYVYRPNTIKGALDEENYGEKLHNATLVSIHDKLIEKITGTLTVEPGKHTARATYTFSDALKAELNGIFENGCYIEGYLVLKNNDEVTISMPYLGFYGDYENAAPVEPFKFERDNDKVYPSDLLNSVVHKWAKKEAADFASDWIMGNWDDLKDISIESIAYNEKNLRQLADGNQSTVIPVGTNPYTGAIETQDIYMGNNGYANTMIISQFVTRTVNDNVITITRKSDNKIVLTDHMYDLLYGAMEDENEEYYQWPLYKSFMNVDWYSANIFATRAYTIIPLYNYEYDEDKEEYIYGDLYEDGEYEIKFSYDIYGGGTYTKTYTLHIDSEAPKIKSIETIDKNGEAYIRVRFDELRYSFIAINGKRYDIQKDDDGYYYDAKVSDYADKDRIFIKSTDFAFGVNGTITHASDKNHISITRGDITNAYDFKQDFKELDKHSFSVSFSYLKSNKDFNMKGNLDFTIDLSNYVAANCTTKIYVEGADGQLSEIAFTLNGNTALFNGDANAKYVIDCDVNNEAIDEEEPVQPGGGDEEPSQPSGKKGCGGSIVAGSALLSIAAALGASLLMFKKRKED